MDLFPELIVKRGIPRSYGKGSMQQGMRSELYFMIKCFEEGWEICRPLHHAYPYDFVIRRFDRWETVQVKSASDRIDKGKQCIIFELRRCSKEKNYNEGDFDLLAVVYKSDVWLMPWEVISDIKHTARIFQSKFDCFRL